MKLTKENVKEFIFSKKCVDIYMDNEERFRFNQIIDSLDYKDRSNYLKEFYSSVTKENVKDFSFACRCSYYQIGTISISWNDYDKLVSTETLSEWAKEYYEKSFDFYKFLPNDNQVFLNKKIGFLSVMVECQPLWNHIDVYKKYFKILEENIEESILYNYRCTLYTICFPLCDEPSLMKIAYENKDYEFLNECIDLYYKALLLMKEHKKENYLYKIRKGIESIIHFIDRNHFGSSDKFEELLDEIWEIH